MNTVDRTDTGLPLMTQERVNELAAQHEQRVRLVQAYIRVLYVIDYKAQLLATSALYHPYWVRNIAGSRALIRRAEGKAA